MERAHCRLFSQQSCTGDKAMVHKLSSVRSSSVLVGDSSIVSVGEELRSTFLISLHSDLWNSRLFRSNPTLS